MIARMRIGVEEAIDKDLLQIKLEQRLRHC